MSLAMFAQTPKTPSTTSAPGLAPNSFKNQMYGPGASVPMRSGPVDFTASSLASQLPAGWNRAQGANPAPAPASPAPAAGNNPLFDGPFGAFFKMIAEKNPQFAERMQTDQFKQQAADNTR